MDYSLSPKLANARLSSFSDTVASGPSTIAREAVGTGMTSGTPDQSSVMFSLSHCAKGKLSMEFSVLLVVCAVNLNAKGPLHEL